MLSRNSTTLWRRIVVTGAIVLVGVAGVAPAAPAAETQRTTPSVRPLERAIFLEINTVRRAHGLAEVRPSWRLARAARAHARSMGNVGYFSHASADGTSFDRRIARFYPVTGYRQWRVGENLLWASPTIPAAVAVERWLASPSHRAVLLRPDWTSLGVSAILAARAPGVYAARDTTIIVTDFGARK